VAIVIPQCSVHRLSPLRSVASSESVIYRVLGGRVVCGRRGIGRGHRAGRPASRTVGRIRRLAVRRLPPAGSDRDWPGRRMGPVYS